jgi:hypothetical protein
MGVSDRTPYSASIVTNKRRERGGVGVLVSSINAVGSGGRRWKFGFEGRFDVLKDAAPAFERMVSKIAKELGTGRGR